MPAIDGFKSHTKHITAPYDDAVAVTPSNTVDIEQVTRALYIGTAGDVRVTMASGRQVTWRNLQIGHHPIRASRIWDTGTTADNITAGW